MDKKTPEPVSRVMDEWVEKMSALAKDGRIDSEIMAQIEYLISTGEIANAAKIKEIFEQRL